MAYDLAPTAAPGTPRQELDTPCYLVDLDTMERNIEKMAAYFKDRPAELRPHMKHHKTPEIARKQIAAGAIGVCCQKLGEAEAMADGGVGVAAGAINTDHCGAHVSEHHAAEGAGADAGQFDKGQSVQWASHSLYFPLSGY